MQDYGQQRTNNTCIKYIDTVAILELKSEEPLWGQKKCRGAT